MALFSKGKTDAFVDVIRCDEPSYLIWKWHPAGTQQGNNKRENSIRLGSSLRVKDGEVAVFVYTQPDGTEQEYIEGPCDIVLTTANLPILANLVGLAYGGNTPFQAEVYFINLARIVSTKFGVPYFDVYDPRFPDFGVPVAVRGTVSFRIADYREFIKLHRLNSFSLDDFHHQIRDTICRYVKDCVANAPAANDIPLIQLETKTAQINDEIEYNISQRLNESFGVEVSGVDIAAIEFDKTSDAYHQLMVVTKNVATTKIQAETQDYIDRLRIQREEGQYAVHKQTQSANLGAFQVEKRAEVGIAGAHALGQMGASGAGRVDLGSARFNPAAMMAGLALGGAVSQNIAGAMNGIMSGAGKATETPPPVPASTYYVAIDGKPTGPYDLNSLSQMAASRQLTAESLVWQSGMENWVKASTVAELKRLFRNTMPPIPTEV